MKKGIKYSDPLLVAVLEATALVIRNEQLSPVYKAVSPDLLMKTPEPDNNGRNSSPSPTFWTILLKRYISNIETCIQILYWMNVLKIISA